MNRRKLRKFESEKALAAKEPGFWSKHGTMISLSFGMSLFTAFLIIDYSDDGVVNLRGADLPWPISIGLIVFFSVAAVISVSSTVKDLTGAQRK